MLGTVLNSPWCALVTVVVAMLARELFPRGGDEVLWELRGLRRELARLSELCLARSGGAAAI